MAERGRPVNTTARSTSAHKHRHAQSQPPIKHTTTQPATANANNNRSKSANASGRSRTYKGTFARSPALNKCVTVMFIRCAERVDRCSPEYLEYNIDTAGVYTASDVNHPRRLIKREKGSQDFYNDSPITELGAMTATLLGRGITMLNLPILGVFSSPALRCVQTAQSILNGMNQTAVKRQIDIEPSLFEYCGWYKRTPQFVTKVSEYGCSAVCAKSAYKALAKTEHIAGYMRRHKRNAKGEWDGETVHDYYARVRMAVQHILKHTNNKPGLVLIVAHASSLDAGARTLIGRDTQAVHTSHMQHIGVHYPYCSTVTLAKQISSTEPKSAQQWNYVSQLLPRISYVGFSNRADAHFLNRHG